MKAKNPGKSADKAQAVREERLKKALKANLARRKVQARLRKGQQEQG